ncbi:DUF2790 domain-containing protein [Pseudomonas stutzeri]|uniref:DUF2790 domain-containing protein n=1 Tax=Stutzerimonas stutzeri KOS6 TaxID=1218352 RepID=A0A061JWS4_STUST|nr:DUF2790 domain-containing protein [Stutzerimonas stutzeri]EWC43324.1 hypothetical protein B597_001620 [Stutzerimonas stutzeri KOS6]MBK3869081.1 DUF2790 domain-containing protein [Stutzerimonas stutzeri]
MRETLIATALLFSSLAQADNGAAEIYTYGTKLDVASVTSIRIEPTPYCEVTDALMTYRDTTGAERRLTYRTLSEACKIQN